MAFLNWFGGDAVRSKGSSPRGSRSLAAPPPEAPEEISAEAGALRTTASADGSLVWIAKAGMKVGRRVVLVFSGVGKATFRVTGMVAGSRPKGGILGTEVVVDESQRGLVRRIRDHLASGSEMPRMRPPRYRLRWPAVVLLPHGVTLMQTASVSTGGCGLHWSGPRPRIGSVYHARLGPEPNSACLRAMVCWVREAPGGMRVGFRFVGGETEKLALVLDRVRGPALVE